MRIGVDFGGTKIEAAALDDDGAFVTRLRRPNPGAYDAAVETVRQLTAQIEAEHGPAASVGVGCPGSASPRNGLMRNANSTYLNGRDFQSDLTAALGREVKLANDANCLALSEALDGAAAGADVAFAVIIGTGCGGGLAVGGKLIEGANGLAGEWGHNPLPWPAADETPGPTCWCGQRGCLEMWVSGAGLQRDYAARHGQAGVAAEQIIAAMRAGQAAASDTFDRYVDRLGRALASMCNLIDPDVVVMGGGMSNVAELYERLKPVIRRHVFSDAWDAALVPARWGDASGVRGAARL